MLIERKDANRDFYGSPIPARDILGGRVPPPEIASKLYEIIEVNSLIERLPVLSDSVTNSYGPLLTIFFQ